MTLKYLTQSNVNEIMSMGPQDLEACLAYNMLKVKKINLAKKDDKDYQLVKGNLKTIEESYKRQTDEHQEYIDIVLEVLKDRKGEK